MPTHKGRKPRDDDSDSSDDSSSSREDYLQAFGGLTVSQIRSVAADDTSSSLFRFKWSAATKVAVLRHAVLYGYTDKVPPPLDTFLHLLTGPGMLRVPLDLGLDIIKVCVDAVRRLVGSVVHAAADAGLIKSKQRFNGQPAEWDIIIATVLHQWDGRRGWKAITLPSSHPSSLASKNSADQIVQYHRLIPNNTDGEEEPWAHIIRLVMDHFSRSIGGSYPSMPPSAHSNATATVPAMDPSSNQHQTHYVPSSYVDMSKTELQNRKAGYEILLRYCRREATSGGPSDAPISKMVQNALDWNDGSLEFVVSKDYPKWVFEMGKTGLLTPEDFGLVAPPSSDAPQR